MLTAFTGALELGILYTIMALGVYLTFRVLDFPDLTVDGSFTTGGAIAAVMIVHGQSPLFATIAAFIGGCLAGAVTGLLHTIGRINALLAGILMMIALYSINIRIMGRANIPLLGVDTVITPFEQFQKSYGINLYLIVFSVVAVLIMLIIDWFLHTEIGLAIRATGDNSRMIRSYGVNTNTMIVIGVSLSNGLVALSGALVAQFSGSADIQMGVGMIVIGLASVIIGEAIFGNASVIRATFAAMIGAILYRLIVAAALRVGLEPSDMKLMTALIVVVAL
ncbi:MAG TPA: ABC transporter permease, partial [Bacilli bacterium]